MGNSINKSIIFIFFLISILFTHSTFGDSAKKLHTDSIEILSSLNSTSPEVSIKINNAIGYLQQSFTYNGEDLFVHDNNLVSVFGKYAFEGARLAAVELESILSSGPTNVETQLKLVLSHLVKASRILSQNYLDAAKAFSQESGFAIPDFNISQAEKNLNLSIIPEFSMTQQHNYATRAWHDIELTYPGGVVPIFPLTSFSNPTFFNPQLEEAAQFSVEFKIQQTIFFLLGYEVTQTAHMYIVNPQGDIIRSMEQSLIVEQAKDPPSFPINIPPKTPSLKTFGFEWDGKDKYGNLVKSGIYSVVFHGQLSLKNFTVPVPYLNKNGISNLARETFNYSTDLDPPVISYSLIPPANAKGWSNTLTTVHFDAVDESEINSITPDIVVDAEGNPITVLGEATDIFGHTASVNVQLKIDKTPPNLQINDLTNGEKLNSVSFSVSGSISDNLSGINLSQTQLLIDGNPISNAVFTETGFNLSNHVLGQGRHILKIVVEDIAGNRTTQTISFEIDSIIPTLNFETIPVANGAGWHNQDVIVSFSATDISGIESLTPDVTVTSEGNPVNINGEATDRFGNVASLDVQLKIDKTPPAIIASKIPSANADNWNNTNTLIKFQGLDVLSGLDIISPDVSISTEGIKTVNGRASDLAGNNTNITLIVKIDKTPPIMQATVYPFPNSNGWHRSAATISFSASDALSGVKSVIGDAQVTTEGLAQNFTGVAIDIAGNRTTLPIAINLDKTAPLISATVYPSPGEFGWHNVDPTVTFTATDATSGIASVTPPLTLPIEGFGQTVSGNAIDLADNMALTEFVVSIDKTKPVVVINEPTEGELITDGFPTFSGVWFESLSGLDIHRSALLLNGTTEEGMIFSTTDFSWTPSTRILDGSHTLEIILYDLAGNFNSHTRNFSISTDNTAPVITFTTPREGQILTDPLQVMSGTIIDDLTGIKQSETSISINGQSFLGSLFIEETAFTFTPHENILNGNHTIELRTQDLAGNKASQPINFVMAAPDNTPPTISFTSIEQGQVFNNLPISIRGTLFDDSAIDTNLTKILIDGTTVEGAITGTSFSYSISAIDTGLHTLEVHAFDVEGNCSVESIEFIFSDIIVASPDFEAPMIQIISPTNGVVLDSNQITVSVNSSDGISGKVIINNIEAIQNGNLWERSIMLEEGENIITVSVRDEAYNFAHESIKVIVDTQVPTFELLGPTTPGGVYQTGGDIILVRGFVSDKNIATIEIGTNASGSPALANITGELYEAFIPVDELTNQVNLTFKDLANNITTSTFNISVDFSLTPSIIEVIPETYGGSIKGGEKIQIIGSNFRAGMTAKIGGLNIINFTVIHDGLSEGITPAVASTGLQDITLHDGTGATLAELLNGFEYKPTFTVTGIRAEETNYVSDSSGQVVINFSTVGFTVNEAEVTMISSSGENVFTVIPIGNSLAINLQDEGENIIILKLRNATTGEEAEQTYHSVWDTTAPVIPEDGGLLGGLTVNTATANSSIVLMGTVNEVYLKKLTVNGVEAEVRGQTWGIKGVSLPDYGLNDITIVAEDEAGGTHQRTIQIRKIVDMSQLEEKVAKWWSILRGSSNNLFQNKEFGTTDRWNEIKGKIITMAKTCYQPSSEWYIKDYGLDQDYGFGFPVVPDYFAPLSTIYSLHLSKFQDLADPPGDYVESESSLLELEQLVKLLTSYIVISPTVSLYRHETGRYTPWDGYDDSAINFDFYSRYPDYILRMGRGSYLFLLEKGVSQPPVDLNFDYTYNLGVEKEVEFLNQDRYNEVLRLKFTKETFSEIISPMSIRNDVSVEKDVEIFPGSRVTHVSKKGILTDYQYLFEGVQPILDVEFSVINPDTDIYIYYSEFEIREPNHFYGKVKLETTLSSAIAPVGSQLIPVGGQVTFTDTVTVQGPSGTVTYNRLPEYDVDLGQFTTDGKYTGLEAGIDSVTGLGGETATINVIDPELDILETNHPANRISKDDTRYDLAVDENARNKILIWAEANNDLKFSLKKYANNNSPLIHYEIRSVGIGGYNHLEFGSVTGSQKDFTLRAVDTTDVADFIVLYGVNSNDDEELTGSEVKGMYEVYGATRTEYDESQFQWNLYLLGEFRVAQQLYHRFGFGRFEAPSGKDYRPQNTSNQFQITLGKDDGCGSMFITHNFGADFSGISEIQCENVNRPKATATMPIYFYGENSDGAKEFLINASFRGEIGKFLDQLTRDEVINAFNNTSGSGDTKRVTFTVTREDAKNFDVDATGGLGLGQIDYNGTVTVTVKRVNTNYVLTSDEDDKLDVDGQVNDIFDFNFFNPEFPAFDTDASASAAMIQSAFKKTGGIQTNDGVNSDNGGYAGQVFYTLFVVKGKMRLFVNKVL